MRSDAYFSLKVLFGQHGWEDTSKPDKAVFTEFNFKSLFFRVVLCDFLLLSNIWLPIFFGLIDLGGDEMSFSSNNG